MRPEEGSRRGLDRRAFLALGSGVIGVAVAPAWLRPRERLVHRSVPVMGTLAELAVPARSEAAARQALNAAAAELHRIEALMTRYRSDSDVGRFNAAVPGTRVPVAPETGEVVRAALEWAERSEGVFDPTLARLTTLWDPGAVSAPPDAEALRRARIGGWRSLAAEGSSGGDQLVRVPGSALDLGGIAKGYGVDRAAAVLREHGVFRGLVNVGGDLMAMGDGPGGRAWRIGVRDPGRPEGVVTTLEVVDRAVATSGDYLRYFEHQGRRYHHVLDGRTRAPTRAGPRSVTVTARSVMAADAAATWAFAQGPEGLAERLRTTPGDLRIEHHI
jgi:thiamine biosynthesis lipoprotein